MIGRHKGLLEVYFGKKGRDEGVQVFASVQDLMRCAV